MLYTRGHQSTPIMVFLLWVSFLQRSETESEVVRIYPHKYTWKPEGCYRAHGYMTSIVVAIKIGEGQSCSALLLDLTLKCVGRCVQMISCMNSEAGTAVVWSHTETHLAQPQVWLLFRDQERTHWRRWGARWNPRPSTALLKWKHLQASGVLADKADGVLVHNTAACAACRRSWIGSDSAHWAFGSARVHIWFSWYEGHS